LIEPAAPPWVVVAAELNQIETARADITKRGYAVHICCGRRKLRGVRIVNGRRVRARGTESIVERPVIPPYLFVELDWDDDGPRLAALDRRVRSWAPLARAKGVDHLLKPAGGGTAPALISAELIDRLRRDEAEGKFDDPTCRRGKRLARDDLKVGAAVRVVASEEAGSPFESFLGTLEAVGTEEARVLLNIFGRLTPVTLPAGNLEIVDC
jgi:transcription antitermination factor NusG